MILSLLVLFGTGTARAADPIPPGPLQDSTITFALLIVYPASKPAAPALKPLLARKWPGLTLVDKLPATPSGMLLQTEMRTKFDPLGADWLTHFGRGLSPRQIAAMQKARPFLILRFFHGKKDAFPALRAAYELADHLARKDGGLIWDDESRELFTPEKWKERRLTGWTEPYPLASDSIVIHNYQDGELMREITLGMGKFGLPDIVVNQVSRSSSGGMASLINLLNQALVEGASVGPGGNMDLSLDKIRNQASRDNAQASLKTGAQKVARVQLLKGTREEGDPENRLVEIGFARYPGPDNSARQEALLGGLFGREDQIKRIHHDEALRAASALARQKLAALREPFQRGLPTGEYLQVKAPFQTDMGGNEWMWVEITRWKGDSMEGVLRNTPYDIKTLKMGQKVKIRQQDVFDYIHTFRDGHQDGDTTSVIIEKMRDARPR